MRKTWVFILAACAVLMFTSGDAGADDSPVIVDEPSVRLEAELNLHYKTFSEVTLTETYMKRWRYKYNYLPGAEVMTDEELFSFIELDLAGLEQVKAAVNKKDYGEARIALVDYFRNRPGPCLLDPGTLSPSSREKIVQAADDFLGNPAFPDVPWPRDVLGRGGKDARWNWVSYLYYSYRYTGEMRYLEGTLRMFSFWYETVRPPAGTPKIWLTPSFIDNPWGSHLAGHKLHTIALFDDILTGIEPDIIPVDVRIPMYKSFIEHGRFLIAVNPGYRSGNIQISQMLELLEGAIYFPEFRESREWIDYAWTCLLKHAWLDLLPDGGHYERSAGYNNAVIRFWRRILELSRIGGLDVPDWLEPRLKEAQEWTIKVYTPTINLAPVGDSSMGEDNWLLVYLIDGALLFPCPEFKFFVEDYPDEINDRAEVLFGDDAWEAVNRLDAVEAKEPDYTSVLLPDTGWAVMRSDWDREALYMLYDYGSNEPWHCHRDGLGFSIFAYGKPLITDCGHAGAYDSDRSKQWYKETISNNLVSINGMSQRKITDGTCDRWVTTPTADFIDAEHDGYKYLGAYCRRKITFVKPAYWIITDNLTEKMCQTTGYHECEWLAHFQPTELTIDEGSKIVHTNNPDANILLLPSRPESLNVILSTGWTVTPEGEADAAPYIAYVREGDLPVDYEVVVYPYKGTDVPVVKVERLDMGDDAWRCKGLKITTPDGIDYYLEALKADYYFILDEETKFRKYGEFSFDGEMALIRERDGELISILLVGGACLKRDGLPLAECAGGIDWAEITFSGNTSFINGEFDGEMVTHF